MQFCINGESRVFQLLTGGDGAPNDACSNLDSWFVYVAPLKGPLSFQLFRFQNLNIALKIEWFLNKFDLLFGEYETIDRSWRKMHEFFFQYILFKGLWDNYSAFEKAEWKFEVISKYFKGIRFTLKVTYMYIR